MQHIIRQDKLLKKVLDYADSLFEKIEQAMLDSVLPAKIDVNFVNNLCKWIMTNFYRCPIAMEIY